MLEHLVDADSLLAVPGELRPVRRDRVIEGDSGPLGETMYRERLPSRGAPDASSPAGPECTWTA